MIDLLVYVLLWTGLLLAVGTILYASLSVQLEMAQSFASDRRAESNAAETDE